MSPTSTMSALASEAPASRLSTLPEGEPDLTLGYEAILWAETVLRQPNGPRARRPFRFTRDQMRFLLWWYALDDDGQWIYQHGVRRLAKGSGKSPFAAVLALIEFCGPVRLARKDNRMPGGCVGKPVDMPWVQIAATAESQTANTMRMVRAMAPKGSTIVREYDIDIGKTRFYRLPEGTLEIITSSVTAAEGAEASLVVADETEHWKPSNGGPELMATLEDNLAKSGSRLLETANAWVPGADSVAEASWEAWLAQEEGRLRDEAGLILYDARLAHPDTDLADFESLTASLQWVFGDCDWKRPYDPETDTYDGPVDVGPILKRIWSPKAKPSESKRKYLNWPAAAEDAWVVPEQWKALVPEVPVVLAAGDEVALFFDGSKSRDATALVGCRIDDGHVFTLGVWEPDPAKPDETVNVADVERVLDLAFQTYDVAAFFADVREWESYAYTEWPKRYGDQLKVPSAPQARPSQVIAWDMRSHTYEFAKACEVVEGEIVDGLFTHDGDSRTTRHVVNARRRPYKDAIGIGKESRDSPRKIDAAVCVVGARMVRRLVLAAGPRRKRRGVVYLP